MAESLLPLRVVGFSNGTVVLRGYRSTVCGRCACDLPGAGQAVWEVRVEAEEAPPKGAQVHLEIAPKDFLAGVATLYGLPLVFLFLAVAVGVWAAPRLGLSGSSAALQIVSAGGGLLLSLPVLHILDRRLARKPGFQPRLIRVATVPEELLGLDAAKIGDPENCQGLAALPSD